MTQLAHGPVSRCLDNGQLACELLLHSNGRLHDYIIYSLCTSVNFIIYLLIHESFKSYHHIFLEVILDSDI